MNPRETGQILFFERYQEGQSLRLFLSFLKETTEGKINFSFCSRQGEFTRNVTVRELILLETSNSKIHLNNDLKINTLSDLKKDNEAIKLFLSHLTFIDKKVRSLSPFELKVLSLSIALLKDTKFLLLESPEHCLDEQMLSILQEILVVERSHGRTVLVSSPSIFLWENHFDQKISTDKNLNFISTSHAQLKVA